MPITGRTVDFLFLHIYLLVLVLEAAAGVV
jgi:hypothetical protein